MLWFSAEKNSGTVPKPSWKNFEFWIQSADNFNNLALALKIGHRLKFYCDSNKVQFEKEDKDGSGWKVIDVFQIPVRSWLYLFPVSNDELFLLVCM